MGMEGWNECGREQALRVVGGEDRARSDYIDIGSEVCDTVDTVDC